MHKKLLFITLAWLCAITGMADTLTIVNRFEKIEHASVMASYRNEFGSYRKPNMDVEFPYALIRLHIDGNKEAVTQAKELFALYLGQHYTTKAKNTSRVNEIMFLVPVGAGHVELQCGDGCQPLTLFDYSQLTADAIYEGKVRYAMDAAVQPDPTPVSRQFFKFRVSPADAMVEVDENGKKEIWKVVDGVARKALYHGNYAYSVSANRYHTQEGVITVSDANTETTIALKPRFGWLSITGGSEANGASVYATNTTTGVRQSLGTIPLTKVELDPGEYALLILQEQYKDYSLSIQISENNETSVRASLAPNFARVTLRAAAGNEILIDEQKKGTGSWTGTLELGDYVVETRQAGHRAAYTSIAVTASSEGKTITLNQPTPIYGSLMVDGLPADATVYVDGVKKGLTPMIVNKLLIGSHQIHIEKEGYAKQEKLVQITEGQEAVMDYALTKAVDKKSVYFSVSATKRVTFSPGNLQYHPANNKWRFAEKQTDYIGAFNRNCSSAYNGWLDLFGWSTNANSFGVSTSASNSDYSGSFVDWGTNKIGNDAPNTWRTLTYAEWEYLLNTRPNASSLKDVAQVNGVNGLILLPDNWTCPSGVNFKSGFHSDYSVEVYGQYQTFTADQWTKLEIAGAVFLPAAGYRDGTNVFYVQNSGNYWSATEYNGSSAGYLYFYSDAAGMGNSSRYYGPSVRLVKDL